MKKSRVILSLVLVLLLVFLGTFVLTACGDKDDAPQNNDQVETPSGDNEGTLPDVPSGDDNQQEEQPGGEFVPPQEPEEVIPGGEITPPQEPEEDTHTCLDKDNNHTCDTCGSTLSICVDTNNNHLCDICNLKLTNCLDSNNNHLCDICDEEISECGDVDNNHLCDICNTKLDSCVDSNNNHLCDKCNTALTECINENNDHLCDVCGETISQCIDEDKDHKCDTCNKESTTCLDNNNDHSCDVCEELLSACIDDNEDTICDICNVSLEISSLQYLIIGPLVDENGEIILDENGEIIYSVNGFKGNPVDIIIPSTYQGEEIKAIGWLAFNRCYSIRSLILPDTITLLDDGAIYGCTNLSTINVSNNLKQVGHSNFQNCSVLEYTIKDNVKYIGSRDNPYVIAVSAIDEYVDSLTLDDSCKIVNFNAFLDMESIKEVDLGDSLIQIGHGAFGYCESLTRVHLGECLEVISMNAFKDCSSLIEIVLPSTVQSIADDAFVGCKWLWEICNYSDLDIEIGDTAYGKIGYYAKNLYTETTGEDLLREDENGFVIYYGESEVVLVDYNGKNRILNIPDGVTQIRDEAFCTRWRDLGGYLVIHEVIIPDTVTTIGDYAFNCCGNLTRVTIGKNVTSIGENAFADCFKLWEIYNKSALSNPIKHPAIDNLNIYTPLSGSSKISIINDCYIYNMDIDGEEFNIALSYIGNTSEVVLPDMGNLHVLYYFINGDDTIVSLKIPATGITTMGDVIVYECKNFEKVYYLGSLEEYFANIGGVGGFAFDYFSDKGYHLYIDGQEVVDLIIPNTVTSINQYLLAYCDSIKTIYMPQNVETVGDDAFNKCNNLESVVFEEDSQLKNIGGYAFNGCGGLVSITIPEAVTSIGYGAFRGCNSLTTVYYGGTVEDWNSITIDDYNSNLTDATRYYYSETEPVEEGNYWHYVGGIPTPW